MLKKIDQISYTINIFIILYMNIFANLLIIIKHFNLKMNLLFYNFSNFNHYSM